MKRFAALRASGILPPFALTPAILLSQRYYCDLHNEVFNTDYYIIGTYQAKEALRVYDVFEAIELVQNYEKEQFGEVYTDLSNPEKLINMVYYIIGDEVICEMYDIKAFNDGWNEQADEETNGKIIKALKEKYNC